MPKVGFEPTVDGIMMNSSHYECVAYSAIRNTRITSRYVVSDSTFRLLEHMLNSFFVLLVVIQRYIK